MVYPILISKRNIFKPSSIKSNVLTVIADKFNKYTLKVVKSILLFVKVSA